MFLNKGSLLVLLVITVLTGISLYFTTRLRFDYDFDNFFPSHDTDVGYYRNYAQKFGNDNNYLLLGIDAPGQVFSSGFLSRLDTLTRFISRQRHVKGVLSPTNLTRPIIEPFGIFEVPYLHPSEPDRLAQDSALIYRTPGLPGTFFARDGRAVSLLVQTSENLTKLPGDTLLTAIQIELQRLHLPDYHIAGRAVAQSVFVDRMKTELAVFMSASILLVIIFLFFTFRTWWGILMPLLVVLLAIIWALGLMGICNVPLDLMTVLLPVIMFVVGMSDSVHILTQYVSETAAGKPKLEAIKTTVKDVGMATLITAITTAIGFLTLLTADISPIRNFGLFTGIAVLLAYVLSMTLLPAMMVLMPVPVPKRQPKPGKSWSGRLTRLLLWVLRFRGRITVGAALLTVLSVISINNIRIDATLLDDLADDDPVMLDFQYFEKHFAGVRPFELHLVAAPGHTILEPAVLHEINKIETYLTQTYGLDFIVSPVTVVKSVNQALNGGAENAYQLPPTPAAEKALLRKMNLFRKRPELQNMLTPDGREARLSGKMSDIGSKKATAKNDSLRAFIQQIINPELLQTRLTGSAVLLDKNNDTLTRNLLEGLLLDIMMIGLIVGLMFRSVRMTAITLIPNLFPILLIAAFMGLTDINLKVSTSIIFTISLGIAIDDTIHFISKLKLELLSGKSLFYALKRTYLTTGKAVIITSCILMSGFCSLVFSNFESTYYVGLLITLTLFFAVFADLLLLPLLVIHFFNPRQRRRQNQRLR